MRSELIVAGALVLQSCGSDAIAPAASTLPPLEVTIVRQFTVADSDIWAMDDDGKNQRDLSGSFTTDEGPVWAADGSAIFFNRVVGATRDIWRMNADGSGQTRLTDVIALTGNPNAFVNDHHQTVGVLFNVRAPDALRTLWKVAADGSAPQQLGAPSRLLGTPPRWSPAGTRVAWSRLVHTVDPIAAELWVMDADGANEMMLFQAAAEPEGPHWDWDPTGNRLALAAKVDGALDIWLVPADGSPMTRLTTGANAAEPVWSADGSKIAYRDFDTSALYIIDSNGTGQVSLTVTGTNPHWSSDGSRLAYCGDQGLAIVGVDGANGRLVDATTNCRRDIAYRP